MFISQCATSVSLTLKDECSICFESECIVSLRKSTIDAAQEFSQLSQGDLIFKVAPDQSESPEDEDQYNSI